MAIKNFEDGKLNSAWPCCMMGNQITQDTQNHNNNRLGIQNVHFLSPQEIFDHPRMEELRNNLIAGIKDPACEVCWDQESRGLHSFRQSSYRKDDEITHNANLEEIDITTSNVCNLRCRMCTPTASNLLMIDHQYFKNNQLLDKLQSATGNRWKGSFALSTDQSSQWKWLENNTDKIISLKMSGGEPFYDAKVLDLLKIYVKNGDAKNTTLIFHTNATQFTDEIIDILSHFKLNNHCLSIDGTDRVYEYIRHPANFAELNTSLNNYFSKLNNRPDLTHFTMVVSALNVLNIAEYIKWTCQFDTNPSLSFAEIYSSTRGIALRHLPKHILKIAKDNIAKYVGDHRFYVAIDNLNAQIDNAIINNAENKQLMLDEITLFDMSRTQSYQDYLDPILVEWFNDV